MYLKGTLRFHLFGYDDDNEYEQILSIASKYIRRIFPSAVLFHNDTQILDLTIHRKVEEEYFEKFFKYHDLVINIDDSDYFNLSSLDFEKFQDMLDDYVFIGSNAVPYLNEYIHALCDLKLETT